MKHKVALLLISTSPMYHRYITPLLESARKFFFRGQFDAILWTDSHETYDTQYMFEIEHAPRPFPSLMRYHFFTSQTETLKQYNYLFFADIDMKFVAPVGEEILGEVVATRHPGYAYPPDSDFYLPFDPNPASTAYVPYPTKYYAGGFQGGSAKKFLEICEHLKRNIDTDLKHNYRARWNDESHWNQYLWKNPPTVELSPSYCFPETFIEYYEKKWGRKYEPKLLALTKKEDLSVEGGKWVETWRKQA